MVVDAFGNAGAMARNMALEFERNGERYAFLRWGQTAFDNFRVVPPGTGICHQVNVEYLAQTVWTAPAEEEGRTLAYPDTLVGTDSHTTMVNGQAVLGWGVGGIEAEAAMLGQPISMLIPEVVGFRLTGKPKEGTTATDLVLTVTEMLRKKGVVGKLVEFYGPGLDDLPLTDRATIANMAPEHGATCGFFPIDKETLRFLEFTGRDAHRIKLVEAYAKAQGLWRDAHTPDPVFTDTLKLDIGAVVPSLAGPKRPQDRIALTQAASAFRNAYPAADMATRFPVKGRDFTIGHGGVMIAAITSCTNTSNPSGLMAVGLLAKAAVEKGLSVKPWVKTSLAPGSQGVTDYLTAAGLVPSLEALGFDVVGYGCTTCVGNSGPLADELVEEIDAKDLTVCAVLSGNRNFEGRVSPNTKANYLASPPLVVACAIAGSIGIDLTTQPLGTGKDGKPVFLKDIWPTPQEIQAVISKLLTPAMYRTRYADVFKGPKAWREVKVAEGLTYARDDASTYVKNPPHFDGLTMTPPGLADIIGARRGNHEVMMRGTFANIRIKNEIAPGTEGGVTRLMPAGKPMSVYDAAMAYQGKGVPLVEGIRHRFIPRLGGKGNQVVGGARGDRRKLRTHPPLQPGRHGHSAVAVQTRHFPQDPAPRRFRDLYRLRSRPGAAASGHHGGDRARRWRQGSGRRDLPHRHAGRAVLYQPWRYSSLRFAQPRLGLRAGMARKRQRRRGDPPPLSVTFSLLFCWCCMKFSKP